jgi:tetratricopeptide (TPR) repeat protein
VLRALIVLTLLTGTAAADRASRAARHFDGGLDLYQAGHYRDASAEFKRAYQIDPLPKYLYNAAQALRLAGDCAAAVPLYEAFNRIAPDEDSRNAGTSNLERCRPPATNQWVERPAEPEPVTVPAPVEPVETTAPPVTTPVVIRPGTGPGPTGPVVELSAKPKRDPSARLRLIAGIGGATAGVLLVSAAVLEGVSASRFGELTRTCAPDCSTGQVLSLQRQVDAATGLFVVSGLVAAATLVTILAVRAHH